MPTLTDEHVVTDWQEAGGLSPQDARQPAPTQRLAAELTRSLAVITELRVLADAEINKLRTERDSGRLGLVDVGGRLIEALAERDAFKAELTALRRTIATSDGEAHRASLAREEAALRDAAVEREAAVKAAEAHSAHELAAQHDNLTSRLVELEADRDRLARELMELEGAAEGYSAEAGRQLELGLAKAEQRADKIVRSLEMKHNRELEELRTLLTREQQRAAQLEAQWEAAARAREQWTVQTPLAVATSTVTDVAGHMLLPMVALHASEPSVSSPLPVPTQGTDPTTGVVSRSVLRNGSPSAPHDSLREFLSALLRDTEARHLNWLDVDLRGRWTLHQLSGALPSGWAIQPAEHGTRDSTMMVYRASRRPDAGVRMLRWYRMVDLAAFLCDGHHFSPVDLDLLLHRLPDLSQLFPAEVPHLTARARWRLTVPVPEEPLRHRLAQEAVAGRLIIGTLIGEVFAGRSVALQVASQLLLDAAKAPATQPSETRRVVSEATPAATLQPLRPEHKPAPMAEPFRLELDEDRLAATRADSVRAQAVLQQLDEELSDAGSATTEVDTGGLDPALQELMTWLATRDEHDLDEARAQAASRGLLLEVAIPQINDWVEAAQGDDPQDPAIRVDNNTGLVWVDEMIKELCHEWRDS